MLRHYNGADNAVADCGTCEGGLMVRRRLFRSRTGPTNRAALGGGGGRGVGRLSRIQIFGGLRAFGLRAFKVEGQMREAAKKFEFEKAAQLRDRLRALKQKDLAGLFSREAAASQAPADAAS